MTKKEEKALPHQQSAQQNERHSSRLSTHSWYPHTCIWNIHTMLPSVQRVCRPCCTSKLYVTSKKVSLAVNRLPGRQPTQYSRLFSASVTRKQPVDQHSNHGHGEEELSSSLLRLYQRDGDRMMLPRAALGVSAFNTTYWLWYTLDFIPAVNASPIQDLHIDPKIGWGALALGVAINAITALYPSLLVSRLDYDPLRNQLRIYRHDFPLLSPSARSTNYSLGDVSMNAADSELKKILGEYHGDWRKYKGHLALKRKDNFMPLLMEIQNGRQEVPNGEALLQAMMRPKALSSSMMIMNDKQTLKAKGTKAKRSKSRRK
jgi:hypothetical protein